MKTLLILALTALLMLDAKAQTTTNTPPETTVGQDLSSAVSKLLSSSNMLWEAHGTYSEALAKKWGGGIGGYYILTDSGGTTISLNSYAGARLDWVDGGFWMPEGNLGLQTPIKIASWLTITPFTYAGIGVPLSGAVVGGISIGGAAPRNNDGQATAILGAGAAIKLFSASGGKYSGGLLADVEKWSGFSGQQRRFGFWIKRNL